MTYADAFVGIVAMALGILGLGAAIANWESCYQTRKARWIEAVAGRNTVRCAYCLLGIGLIVLGFAITRGFAPNRSATLFGKLTPAFATRSP
jgi:cytochrome b561